MALSPGTKKAQLEIKNWPTHYRREIRFTFNTKLGLLSCVVCVHLLIYIGFSNACHGLCVCVFQGKVR